MAQIDVTNVAVVGAGNMGSGIAQKYAAEGFHVLLLDTDQAALDRGMGRLSEVLREGVSRKVYREDVAEAIRERIRPTLDWNELRGVGLVIEAVFEELEVKQAVFRRLGEVTRPRALLATNTSSFYVRQMAEVTAHPERVLGLHYFYHPAKNRLVEVVAGPSTTPEVLKAAWDLQEQIGKTPIASADAPGFVINRFFVPWINEAARMLEEGVADIPTCEQAAIEGFRIGMGPFELMNVTGIPIGHHAASTLARELGPFYKPAELLRSYKDQKRSFVLTGGAPDRARFDLVRERLQGLTFHIVSQLVSEGVGTPEDVDIGSRVGLRWGLGPFEMMNKLGLAETRRIVGAVEERYGLETPRILRDQITAGSPFPIRLVKLEVDGGVATLTFNRPDAMNALNPELAAQLKARLEEAIADPGVKGIVLAGAGKAFVAGADIRFFVRNMKENRYDRIQAFAEEGHALLRRIESCPKPVVARLDGLSLGGGTELALACDQIIATPKGSLGFPETGIGIYPGLGGTQRTSRRCGEPLTRWLVFTGQVVDAATAQALGLVDRVVPHAELAGALTAAVQAGKKAPQRQGPARADLPPGAASDPRLAAIADYFERTPVDLILAGGAATQGRGDLETMAGRIRSRAPLALRTADTLIREGAKTSLDEGLRLEVSRLMGIFRTEDAMTGLSSLGQKEPPVFRGA